MSSGKPVMQQEHPPIKVDNVRLGKYLCKCSVIVVSPTNCPPLGGVLIGFADSVENQNMGNYK